MHDKRAAESRNTETDDCPVDTCPEVDNLIAGEVEAVEKHLVAEGITRAIKRDVRQNYS